MRYRTWADFLRIRANPGDGTVVGTRLVLTLVSLFLLIKK